MKDTERQAREQDGPCQGSRRGIYHDVSLFILVLVISILYTPQALASVDAWLDTNKVNIGESLQLTIKADGRVSGEPDLSPVEKDFDILGKSSSTSVNFINGSLSTSTTWYYTLSPKKKGRLIIPPLDVNGAKTPELILEVAGTSISSADSASDIFIETSCEPQDPFVQQEIICTVRLYAAREITDGTLSEPQAGNAIIRKLGKDQEFNRIRNSRRYRIIQRKYAIFPQESGRLTITSPVFSGTVVVPGSRSQNDPFSAFLNRDPFFSHALPGLTANTKEVRIKGKDIDLMVKPLPAAFKGRYWLPATSVSISGKMEPKNGNIHVGDPITRTVTVVAQGLTGEQLPDLSPASVPGCNVYPDTPQIKNSEHSTGITGSRIQKITFIPQRPGTVTIPPIVLRWWNTDRGQAESVSLPGRTIIVLPASSTGQSGPASHTAPSSAAAPEQASNPNMVKSLKKTPASATSARQSDRISTVYMWTTFAFALAWLITALLLIHERCKNGSNKRRPENIGKAPGQKERIRQIRREFHQACRNNDAVRAKNALLKWAAAAYPEDPPAGLSELARRLGNSEAAQELERLNRVLYHTSTQAWDRGPILEKIIRDMPVANRKMKHTSCATSLPPLYPGRGVDSDSSI